MTLFVFYPTILRKRKPKNNPSLRHHRGKCKKGKQKPAEDRKKLNIRNHQWCRILPAPGKIEEGKGIRETKEPSTRQGYNRLLNSIAVKKTDTEGGNAKNR